MELIPVLLVRWPVLEFGLVGEKAGKNVADIRVIRPYVIPCL
jgi:hypothetical protein